MLRLEKMPLCLFENDTQTGSIDIAYSGYRLHQNDYLRIQSPVDARLWKTHWAEQHVLHHATASIRGVAARNVSAQQRFSPFTVSFLNWHSYSVLSFLINTTPCIITLSMVYGELISIYNGYQPGSGGYWKPVANKCRIWDSREAWGWPSVISEHICYL